MKELLKFTLKFIGKILYLGAATMCAVWTANDLLHMNDWD